MTAPPVRATKVRAILVAILLASIALSAVFAAKTPMNRNPDEVDHRDYIRLIVRNHGLVRFTPIPFFQASTEEIPRPFETHQPPLYYLLCVPVLLATGGSLFALRMVASIFQLLTILVVFRAMRDLFPHREVWWLGAAGFVAFLPSMAQLAGAVSNDSLTTLLCAIIFWKCSRLFRRDYSLRNSLLIGAALGVGIWTKLTVLQLLPAIALAFVFAVTMQRCSWRQAFTGFATAVGLGLAIGSPWFIRNTLLYGDPLAIGIYKKTGPNMAPGLIMQFWDWSWGDYARNVGVRSFASFWYIMDPKLPRNHFTGDPLPLLIVLVIALVSLYGVYRWCKAVEGTPSERRFLGFCVLAVLTLVPFFTKFVLTVFQAQGRYFLPVLLPVAAVSAAGWATIFPAKRAAWGILLLNLALIGLCLYQMATEGVY